METKKLNDKLLSLQDILVKKYELQKKIEEAPKHLGNDEELLARMKKSYISNNAEYEALKEKIAGIKADLEKAINEVEESEKSMDTAQGREIETLDKQITEARKKEEDLRKVLSQEEKTLQAMDANLQVDLASINDTEKRINDTNKTINSKIDAYNKELADLKKKEDAITPSLDQEIIFKFQRIIQRNSEGIVAVKNGVCTGCHMILPAQFANTVHVGDSILFCPYCSRVLFYEESDAEETQSFYNLAEAGSLSFLDDDEEDDGSEKEESTETIDQTENRLNGNSDDSDSYEDDSDSSSEED